MRSDQYVFKGHQGQNLSGRLDLPDGPILAYALFAHCFTCSKDFIASRMIAQALAARGIATLRFDFTGLGNSQGDFANTHFTSNVDDLVLAAQSLAQSHGGPQLLVGHSLGGAAVLAAASRIESARAIATLAAPFDPAHVLQLFSDDLDTIARKGEARVDLAGRPFTIAKSFLDDITSQDQRAKIADLRKALLVMHAPSDTTVGIENARAIFEAARHPKSFISLDHMDHLLTKADDVRYAADLLASWATRYITIAPAPRTAEPPIADGAVHVAGAGAGRFAFDVAAGRHRFRADEPVSAGGDDSGPSPYDFLLAALGACTAMTLKIFAAHKKLALDDVKIALTHTRMHAKDCAACETKSDGYVANIRRDITLIGDLDDEARARLLQIADRCPVHKTLEGEIRIETVLAPKAAR